MSFFINNKCTLCKACPPVCPTGSIFMGDHQYVIDSDTCNDCEVCVSVCPENAIHKMANSPDKSADKPPQSSSSPAE